MWYRRKPTNENEWMCVLNSEFAYAYTLHSSDYILTKSFTDI